MDGPKEASLSVTLNGDDVYSYNISGNGSDTVSGTFSNATRWELKASDAALVLSALKGVISNIKPKSSEVPVAVPDKPVDFRRILSELLDRISSIVNETQSVIEETRSKMK